MVVDFHPLARSNDSISLLAFTLEPYTFYHFGEHIQNPPEGTGIDCLGALSLRRGARSPSLISSLLGRTFMTQKNTFSRIGVWYDAQQFFSKSAAPDFFVILFPLFKTILQMI